MGGRCGVAVCALVLGSCQPDLEIDEPPDVEQALIDYQDPSGNLQQLQDVSGFFSQVEDAVVGLARGSTLSVGLDAVEAVVDPLNDLALPADPEPIGRGLRPLDRDDLVARVDTSRTCPGASDAATPDPALDGQILLRGAADRDGLYPVFWGDMVGCRQRIGDDLVQLDGAISFVVDAGRDRISTRDISREPIIARFEGRLQTSGLDEPVIIEARLSKTNVISIGGLTVRWPTTTIQTRLRTSVGTFVLVFAETTIRSQLPSILTFGVYGNQDFFRCTAFRLLGTGVCESELTGEVVQW